MTKESVGCPVVFSEEFIAFFEMKKSQGDTENDKKSIISQIFKKLRIFSKFSQEFADRNIKKGQQGKICCPVCFLEEFFSF